MVNALIAPTLKGLLDEVESGNQFASAKVNALVLSRRKAVVSVIDELSPKQMETLQPFLRAVQPTIDLDSDSSHLSDSTIKQDIAGEGDGEETLVGSLS